MKTDGEDAIKQWEAGETLLSPDELEAIRKGAEEPLPDCAREPILVTLADVAPQAVSWLWEPYLPLGKLILLEGDPGCGKTWIALQVAASLTRGWALPGAKQRPPVTVLYMTAEDGLADTLRPRLDVVKADVSRVIALAGHRTVVDGKERAQQFSLTDLDVLKRALERVKPAMIVIDPLQGYLGSGVDMHRANEVRPILSGLMRVAEQHNCAVLGIRHLAKGTTSRVMYRGLGSIDFTAAARSVLLAGEDPQSRKRAIAHVKSSLGPKGVTIGYRLGPAGFEWEASTLTATDLVSNEGEDEAEDRDQARHLLEEMLAVGERSVDEVNAEARKLQISDRALRKAKRELGVKPVRVNEHGRRGSGRWVLRLPSKRPHPDIRPNALNTLDEPEEE